MNSKYKYKFIASNQIGSSDKYLCTMMDNLLEYLYEI